MPAAETRRRFLTNLTFAAAGLAGARALGAGAAEPPPEVTTIRFAKDPVTCIAPQAAEELLRAEGFTDTRYVALTEADIRNANATDTSANANLITHGKVDFARDFALSYIASIDRGAPITLLTGLHSGCFEVFGKDDLHSIGDLKGRTVGVANAPGDERLLKIMATLVGLDPARDIKWVLSASREPMDLFIEGRIDAFLATPPTLQEVRERKIGHVIASSITDRPWSQYYCCFLATSTEFARRYPAATKRVLRAILKAVDLCSSEPARMARLLVEGGYADRYDYAFQALSEIRFDVWRDYDPEDTLRFYALRLYEAGLIKSSPQKLIAEHTEWRFLNELKRELKA